MNALHNTKVKTTSSETGWKCAIQKWSLVIILLIPKWQWSKRSCRLIIGLKLLHKRVADNFCTRVLLRNSFLLSLFTKEEMFVPRKVERDQCFPIKIPPKDSSCPPVKQTKEIKMPAHSSFKQPIYSDVCLLESSYQCFGLFTRASNPRLIARLQLLQSLGRTH